VHRLIFVVFTGARYQIEDQNNTIRSPDHSPGDYISEFEMMEKMLMDGKMKAEKPDFKILSKNFQSIDISTPEMQQKIDFMRIQAQVGQECINVTGELKCK
jgi:hypothetical protein